MSEENKDITGSHDLFLSDDKVFYTIEGEGEFIGQPSVFMRLSMCNLTCKGFPLGKRYIPYVLSWHADMGSGFKFVIKDHSDIEEVLSKYVDEFDIPAGRVWLMPCCGSRQEHSEVSGMVAELAKEHHFNFSPRLQLVIWDKALSV